MFASQIEAANDADKDVFAHGTEMHTPELRATAGEEEACYSCTATLRCDPLATPDFAVCIIIQGLPVGYLGATDGADYIRRYGMYIRSCRAAVLGKASEPWRLDVRLGLDL
ncbi:MAG TPA: hypothetical protein VN693_07185 [Rhodanobacteraceae bacterium]|nr:hypothetical protein [Rhodanobacteraceae bacterium]